MDTRHRPRPRPSAWAVLCLGTVVLAACTTPTDPGDEAAPAAADAPVAVPSDVVTPAPPATAAEPSPSPSPTVDATATAAAALPSADGPVRFTVAFDDPASPAELAAVLAAAEEAVRDDTLPDADRALAAHRAQRAYRQLGRTEAWREEALAALPERWRFAAEQNVAARDALALLHASADPPTSLPSWEIVTPEPPEVLEAIYREAEEAIGVDWELLAAINLVETRMGRIRGFSSAGARGPMQFIPASWEAFGAGGDIDDARDSIFAAARHLTQRPGSPPSDRGALFNYNNSEHYVDAVLAYADVLRADPGAYRGYHGWQVYYTLDGEEFLLPVGYREEERVPVDEYRARPALDVVG